jgi:hypothetical protein
MKVPGMHQSRHQHLQRTAGDREETSMEILFETQVVDSSHDTVSTKPIQHFEP